MSIANINVAGQSAAQGASRQQGAAAPVADFAAILDAFKAEAAKTPAERARDEVLKKHDLTEDSYRQLPERERESIDREIAEAVQRTLRRPRTAAA